MPKYTYKCQNCNSVFDYYHRASENKRDCESCAQEAVLTKIPTGFSVITEEKAGNIVKNSIREFKEELEAEKQLLKNQVWETDE